MCWGRGSTPADGSARPISARGCWRPTIPALAAELAQRLDGYNRERREIEARTLAAAIAAVEAVPQSPVLTFVAGVRLASRASSASSPHGSRSATSARPASSPSRTGSAAAPAARSPGLPLGPAVIAARQAGLLLNGGGHAMAAGFTVAAEKLDALREFLAERLGDGLDREMLVPELAIDGALSVAAAQAELIGHIERLAPFGAANPEPRFVFPTVRVAHVEPVGNGHLRCALADPLDRRRGCRRSPSAPRKHRSAVFSPRPAAPPSTSPAICAATAGAAATPSSW